MKRLFKKNFESGIKGINAKFATILNRKPLIRIVKTHTMEQHNTIIAFENTQIRRVWHNEEWHFSVIDVIEILTNSPTPRKYWNTLKTREPQLSSLCGQLKLLYTEWFELPPQ